MREAILTARLLLRDVTEADAVLLFELDADPEVMRYVGPRPPADVQWYRDRTRTVYVPMQVHPWHGARLVHHRANGEFLGWVFARPATDSLIAREVGWTCTDEIEVGYRFRRSAWGRGLATEAATALVEIALADPTTTAVVACSHAENTASLRVLAKLGLVRVSEVILAETNEPLIRLARGR
jgi:RimJ/RimL family protein N-acetyltransferase